MKNKEKEKEVDYAGQDKFNTAITVVVITLVVIITSAVALMAILQHDFEKAETKFFEDFTISSSPELWERVPDLLIYPWNEYHKYSTRELSQEQGEFLQGKRVAECMVDMVNYDGVLIKDKESAVSLLYTQARRLLTDDDKEYYVWNQIQVEGVYLFSMVSMNGDIFSFHYVTDMECDETEAIRYVRESFKDDKNYHSLEEEYSSFIDNRNFYVKTVSEKLTKYKNLDTTLFYQNIDLRKKPVINEENGNVVLIYISETKTDYFVFLYLDCKTKKVSGYHLILC
ncbi:MAG: hypothetical protein HFH63_05115 [Lachnospiraceae bacterium]|nr:hypothetical protein [Lachnospiraceae bacterium]MCI8825255.1 hypothetical protein [Lachnospiraceae bacterium]